jgi:predicted SnoaL-like aldol condensation-catalyzing enzyme
VRVPNRAFTVQRVLEDGDHVVVHSKVERSAKPFVVSVVHIFRFEGERIAELWDVGMPVPDPCPNADGPF